MGVFGYMLCINPSGCDDWVSIVFCKLLESCSSLLLGWGFFLKNHWIHVCFEEI